MWVSHLVYKPVRPWLQGQRAEACKNHLHQMHICLPSRKGHTRLLYRMSLDFMNWTRFVPGIQIFWQNIANQVCGRPQPRRFDQGHRRRLLRHRPYRYGRQSGDRRL